jgi:predicted transcriptional regulator
VNSTLRNRFSRIVSRLELKGLIESEKGAKMKAIHLTDFGSILAEALAEGEIEA